MPCPNAEYLPPANVVCEGYVFTGVCLSTRGGGSASVHAGMSPQEADPPQEAHPPKRQTPPKKQTLPQEADPPKRQTPQEQTPSRPTPKGGN